MKPEIEAFDTGHLWYAKQLVKDGVLSSPALVQLCMGIPWGAPNDLNTFMAMVNNVPADWNWSAFSIGRDEMPYVAASVLAGGNVRVGLEDNLWLSKGELATNEALVSRAVSIIENMGAPIMGPDAVRQKLGLTKQAPRRPKQQQSSAVESLAAVGPRGLRCLDGTSRFLTLIPKPNAKSAKSWLTRDGPCPPCPRSPCRLKVW